MDELSTQLYVGVATASHQIEGGNTNNWTRFEPRSKSGQESGDACDHWNRKKQDLELIKDLNVTHYRFSGMESN